MRATLGAWTSWSRTRVAQEAHIHVSAIAHLEQTGSGTAASLEALARFYHRQGANLNWLFTTDTKNGSPYSFEERWADDDRRRTFEELIALRSDAQDPFIRARITTLLVQLLPSPSCEHRSEVDLQQYQHYLPPVVATASGWRTRAFNIPPHHYYVVGKSVPECGMPFEYLTDDLPPERTSSYTTCSQCAKLISPQ